MEDKFSFKVNQSGQSKFARVVKTGAGANGNSALTDFARIGINP